MEYPKYISIADVVVDSAEEELAVWDGRAVIGVPVLSSHIQTRKVLGIKPMDEPEATEPTPEPVPEPAPEPTPEPKPKPAVKKQPVPVIRAKELAKKKTKKRR